VTLTFNVWTFKLSGTYCGQNLNGPKSLTLQTFRKDYIFSILWNIEILTINNLKNKFFYIYTKEKLLQMKIFCDYFVMKYKISFLVACFLGNATRNCVGSRIWMNMFIGRSLFTLTNTIICTYNIFEHFLFNVIHSRTANLGGAFWLFVLQNWTDSCSSRICTNQSLVEVGLLYPAFGLNREHLVEVLISPTAMQTNLLLPQEFNNFAFVG
jgi:hypothetical protein